VLDSGALRACDIGTVAAAGALLEAGAAILQLRHKDNYTRAVFAEAETVAGMCRDAGALLVVNDRADIARLLSAGLHLGQDDLTPQLARTICGADALIGFSTHNEEQLRAAEQAPVDYLALGPIFGTASKRNPDPVVGVEELRRLRPLTQLPLAGIGGITMDNAGAVFEAGADAVAVIGDLLNGVRNAAQLRARTEEWLRLTNR